MEVAVERPPVKEEKRADDAKPEITTIGSALPIVFESFRCTLKDASIKQEDRKLEAAKAEMGEVKEENERLKTLLSRIVSEYQSLQMHFRDVVKVEQADKTNNLPVAPASAQPPADDADDLVSLTLGSRVNGARRKGHERSSSGTTADEGQLSLGLRLSTDDDKASRASAAPMLNLSSDSSSADDTTAKAAHAATACPPSSTRKSPSGGAGAGDGADDEVQQQQQAKKARVSVRVKCDTPTMNDGCQWRKYGQKISKGNPCPRAYYRCTVAPNCPVRKQVQRCAEDTSILITTYEGTHSHQLPPAATAMASTTSAAAAMLTAGSTTSSGHHHLPLASARLLGATTMVSTAASCPTITLDLTAPAPPHYAAAVAGYESKAVPAAWSSGYLAYAAGAQPSYYGKSSPAMGHLFGGSLLGAVSRPEQMYAAQSYLQRASGGVVAPALTDTLAKVITSDPSFQSALAAAITSCMGRGGGAAAHK